VTSNALSIIPFRNSRFQFLRRSIRRHASLLPGPPIRNWPDPILFSVSRVRWSGPATVAVIAPRAALWSDMCSAACSIAPAPHETVRIVPPRLRIFWAKAFSPLLAVYDRPLLMCIIATLSSPNDSSRSGSIPVDFEQDVERPAKFSSAFRLPIQVPPYTSTIRPLPPISLQHRMASERSIGGATIF